MRRRSEEFWQDCHSRSRPTPDKTYRSEPAILACLKAPLLRFDLRHMKRYWPVAIRDCLTSQPAASAAEFALPQQPDSPDRNDPLLSFHWRAGGHVIRGKE